MQDDVNKNDYQVVSKPSVANKAEANEENLRQSVIDKKLTKVKKLADAGTNGKVKNAADMSIDSARQESARLQEVKDKLMKEKKLNQEMKFELQKKQDEIEQKNSKITQLNSLVKELKQYNPAPQS